MRTPYSALPTPSLLIDLPQTLENIRMMQEKADQMGVSLRPHIKTHRSPFFAKKQIEAGARGIACAKLGEAIVMANSGIEDIFIANELIGRDKYTALRALHEKIHIRTGIDSFAQLQQMEEVFSSSQKPLEVLIELEVGEERSGVTTDAQLTHLAQAILESKHISLKGIFSHEGHTYKAQSAADCREKALRAHQRTIRAAEILRELGADIDTLSVGATPSAMLTEVAEGITELRVGTYIFFDAAQAQAIRDFSRCSATVLTSVISTPTKERVVLDAGAKALATQNRTEGNLCHPWFWYAQGRGRSTSCRTLR